MTAVNAPAEGCQIQADEADDDRDDRGKDFHRDLLYWVPITRVHC